MTKTAAAANFFERILLIVLITLTISFCGCKYGHIVSLSEQIAIYENKGFIKIENPQSAVTIENITLNINSVDSLNQHFLNNNITCKINSLSLLYMPLNANYIAGLLYIYSFEDNNSALDFYTLYYPKFQNSLYINNNFVIQKGISIYIYNGAQNYKYFTDFCNGLK